jgi:predicted metal-binding protein
MTTSFVSISCKAHDESPTPEQPRSGSRPFAALRANAETLGGELAVVLVARPAHCARACTLALGAAAKPSGLGALAPDRDAADVAACSVARRRRRPVAVASATRARPQAPARSRPPPQPETSAR